MAVGALLRIRLDFFGRWLPLSLMGLFCVNGGPSISFLADGGWWKYPYKNCAALMFSLHVLCKLHCLATPPDTFCERIISTYMTESCCIFLRLKFIFKNYITIIIILSSSSDLRFFAVPSSALHCPLDWILVEFRNLILLSNICYVWLSHVSAVLFSILSWHLWGKWFM